MLRMRLGFFWLYLCLQLLLMTKRSQYHHLVYNSFEFMTAILLRYENILNRNQDHLKAIKRHVRLLAIREEAGSVKIFTWRAAG